MSTIVTSMNLLCGLPLSSCLVGPSSTALEQYICYPSSALAQTISGWLPSYKPSLSIWILSFSHKSVGVGGDNTHLHQLQPACILYFISLAHYPFYWMADPRYFNYATFTISPQFTFTFLFQKKKTTVTPTAHHCSAVLIHFLHHPHIQYFYATPNFLKQYHISSLGILSYAFCRSTKTVQQLTFSILLPQHHTPYPWCASSCCSYSAHGRCS